MDQKVVVQGGLSGLAGGATPQHNEIALSLERMSGIETIDPTSMTLTALAGTPLQAIQEAAEDVGTPFSTRPRRSWFMQQSVETLQPTPAAIK